ncbi:MAG: hypothetical protein LBH37_00705 [Oscillospiraceae bacterium]|jgi:hypothetical protein|nr:hypothetical protein [Oscillospiraceae bacterium]
MDKKSTLKGRYNYFVKDMGNNQMLFIFKLIPYVFIALIFLISTANIFNTITTSVALRKREFDTLKSIGIASESFNKIIYHESFFSWNEDFTLRLAAFFCRFVGNAFHNKKFFRRWIFFALAEYSSGYVWSVGADFVFYDLCKFKN